jgi:hypothetical protein
VYLYREASLVGPGLLERLIARRNPRVVYDFDDAIWQRYVSPRNRYFSFSRRQANADLVSLRGIRGGWQRAPCGVCSALTS